MDNRIKYFVFNKARDFERGYSENILCSPEGIRIKDPAKPEGGSFFSRVLDSREKETEWHRIIIHSKSLGDASIRFSFYASEERRIRVNGMETEVDQLLKDETLQVSEKEQILRPWLVKTVMNPEDTLLHEAKGRYLWFLAELFPRGVESPEISKVRIFFPKQTWLSWLPEVYQNDPQSASFTGRFLSVFQSLYDDMDEEIRQVSGHFDPDTAEGEFLHWLAGWLDVDDPYIWTEEQLRYLLKNGMGLYKGRGTRETLHRMVELYTGEAPWIIENFQVEPFQDDARIAELMSRLYGDHPCLFTVVVRENCVPTEKEYRTLLKIIESAKPAHEEANVVVLKPYIFLDKYSYLGINSVLGQYRPVSLDGFSALPFTSVTSENRKDVLL